MNILGCAVKVFYEVVTRRAAVVFWGSYPRGRKNVTDSYHHVSFSMSVQLFEHV